MTEAIAATTPRFRLGDRVVDLELRRVTTLEREQRLTAAEAGLLGALYDAAGTSVSRIDLTTDLLGFSVRAQTRTLDTLVWRLRAKVEPDPQAPRHIVSVRGEGLALIGAEPVDVSVGAVLIGRADALASIHTALRLAQVVQICGPGGIGKSALLNVLRETSAPVYESTGGTGLTNIEGLHDASSVLRAIAAALGVEPGPADVVRQRLSLRGDSLLIIDHADDVPPATLASVYRDTLARVPGLRVVIAARRAISAIGGPAIELAPLSAAAAEALLKARTPDVPVSATLLSMALEEAQGNPLALNLVANRIARGEPNPTDAAQLGLKDVLQRSWTQLPRASQGDLARLSAIRRPARLEDAAAIFSAPLVEAADRIEQLRRHSVLSATADGTFAQHALMRELATTLLPDIAAAARHQWLARHATFADTELNALTWSLIRRDEADLVAALAEVDDLATRTRLAIALTPMATHVGSVEVEMIAVPLRAATRSLEPGPLRTLANEALVELLLSTADPQGASVLLGLADDKRSVRRLAADARLGLVRGERGELGEHRATLRARLAQHDLTPSERALLLSRLGSIEGRVAHLRDAEACFREALDISAGHAWPGLTVELYQLLATILSMKPRGMDEAIAIYGRASSLAERAGLARYNVTLMGYHATALFVRGRAPENREGAEKALALARRHAQVSTIVQAQNILATLALRLGDTNEADRILREASTYGGADSQQREFVAHIQSLVALTRGEPEAARAALNRVGMLATRPFLSELIRLTRVLLAILEEDLDAAELRLAEAREALSADPRRDFVLALDLAAVVVERHRSPSPKAGLPAALRRRLTALERKEGAMTFAIDQIRLLVRWCG